MTQQGCNPYVEGAVALPPRQGHAVALLRIAVDYGFDPLTNQVTELERNRLLVGGQLIVVNDYAVLVGCDHLGYAVGEQDLCLNVANYYTERDLIQYG